MGNIFSCFDEGGRGGEISPDVACFIQGQPNYPADFKALVVSKKVTLSQEQEAAQSGGYKAFGDTEKIEATDAGAEQPGDNDLLPGDFVDQLQEFAESSGFLESGEFDVMSMMGAPEDLIGALKQAGQIIAPFVPGPDRVGKGYASRSMKDKKAPKSYLPEDHEHYEPKPEEALHFKAIEGSMLDRYQTAKILERRPSCSAHPCETSGCENSTFHLSGYCTKCLDAATRAEHHKKHITKLGSDVAPMTLDGMSAAIKDMEGDPKKKKTSDKMNHLVNGALLRRAMEDKASEFEKTDKIVAEAEEGKGKLRSSHLKGIDTIDMAQLYGQFKLFDVDKDGYITLDDLVKVVSYIDPDLAKAEDLREKCQAWFGQKTFYPNSSDPNVEIKVDFEDYVIAVYSFRILTAQHKLHDNLKFPFWALRDCVVYGQHRHLEGWAWKRGSGNAPGWKKRHFRMCKDEGDGSKIMLTYFENDTDDESKLKDKRTKDLRQLISVQFSTKTALPKGADIPKDLTVFKLLFNDQTRMTLACEPKDASDWTAKFTNYALAGRLIIEWRIQYGLLKKDKITTRDWINAGMVIVSMQQYLKLQRDWKNDLKDATEKAEKEKDEEAKKKIKGKMIRQLKKSAGKFYVPPKERLILKVCGISEDNLANSMVAVQGALFCWANSKETLKWLDDNYAYSGVRTAWFLGKNGVIAYRYYADCKNAYKGKRYGVAEWQDVGSTRDCAVCREVFKSVTTKAEKKKHHCRSCGRVVCHACSTNMMYFQITDKVKRVCDECLCNGAPVKAVNPFEKPPADIKATDDDDDYEADLENPDEADDLEMLDEGIDLTEDSNADAYKNIAQSAAGMA